jgi:hypothetical protein
MSVDLDAIPFVPARWYRVGRLRPIRLLVVHTPEFPELNDGAERLANYFATTDRPASVHVTVDNDSMVRSVADKDTAYGAENANADGLHAELVGYAGQTADEWDDDYSRAVIANAAGLFRAWADRYGIPLRRLTVEQIRAGEPGIAGHADVYQALGGQAFRSDPGAAFPWDRFMAYVTGGGARQGGHAPVYHVVIPGPAPGNPRTFKVDGLQIIAEIAYNAPRGHYAIHQEAWDALEKHGIPIVDGTKAPPFGTEPLIDTLSRYTRGDWRPGTGPGSSGGVTAADVRAVVADVIDGATIRV